MRASRRIASRGIRATPRRSLRGAERALGDIEAAIAALRPRPEVSKGRLLIGGQSRGGLLSIAYAAKHPDQVLGAINFVGGWLAEACSTAAAVNKALFRRGAGYPPADPMALRQERCDLLDRPQPGQFRGLRAGRRQGTLSTICRFRILRRATCLSSGRSDGCRWSSNI